MAGDRQNASNIEDKCVVVEQAKQTLTYEQVLRLGHVVDNRLQVPGRGNYPNLNMSVRKLILAVRRRLENDGMPVVDVRINGSAASYIAVGGSDIDQECNDLDLIFRLDQPPDVANDNKSNIRRVPGYDLDQIKDSALMALQEFLGPEVNRERLGPSALADAYIQKMVKIDTTRINSQSADRWSLMSLDNLAGRSVEMKFVVSMRRQYEFSIDSFQVIVDSFLQFCDVLPAPLETDNGFFPTVVVESAYGDVSAALDHAKNKLIEMRAPEQVRGGGLLKYCALTARGYKPAPTFDASNIERYMCSRFFIDFPDLERQQNQFENYLTNHLSGSLRHLRKKWLSSLREVVSRGARCVNNNRRNHTIDVIDLLVSAEEHDLSASYWPPIDQRHTTVSWNSGDRQQTSSPQSECIPLESDLNLIENASVDGSEREMDVRSVGSSVPSDITAESDSVAEGSITSSGSVSENVNEQHYTQPSYRPYYFGLYPYAFPSQSFYVPCYPVFYAPPPVLSTYVQRS